MRKFLAVFYDLRDMYCKDTQGSREISYSKIYMRVRVHDVWNSLFAEQTTDIFMR